jgi:hypothetical protein
MKGINFKQPLFDKVISGEKTQMRRIVKPQPSDNGLHDHDKYPMSISPEYDMTGFWGEVEETGEMKEFKPRYKVGETLYLKEPYDRSYIPEIGDKYDNPLMAGIDPKCWETIYRYEGIYAGAEWRNAIFMPAKYARYFIEITGIHCEQLQDISDEDCMREGCIETRSGDFYFEDAEKIIYYKGCMTCQGHFTPRQAYAALIDKTYGEGTWDSNAYAWVYDFKLVK